MYRNIMLAVDGSASSKRAIEEALRIAALAHATVHAVYVVDKSALFNYGGYYDPQALLDALRGDGRSALGQVHSALAAGGVQGDEEIIETESMADDVATCLQRHAERIGADLVVMGTHGRRGVPRLVLGSVSERFLRFSTCPVMLVRGEPETEQPA
ncbi:universal stress protein [Trinickia sp. NRRL B-1857]|uniref:universal stress protein n=1 Tax=Trinickia sp. NRRL B-1857 TaxID=3162879 RepID=UPI003D26C256